MQVNLFNIPLFEIVTKSAVGSVLHLAYAIGPAEDEPFFTWAFEQDKKLRRLAQANDPLVALTDWDEAQRNAIKKVYKTTQLQLCVWHILKNFIKAIKDLWIGSTTLTANLPTPETPAQRNCLVDALPTIVDDDAAHKEYPRDPRGMYDWFSNFVYAKSQEDCDALAQNFECFWEEDQPGKSTKTLYGICILTFLP